MPHTVPLAADASPILVVAPSWIGDTLMAQSLLTLLAQRGASIDVLAPDWTAPLLSRMPEVRRVISSPFRHGDFALAADDPSPVPAPNPGPVWHDQVERLDRGEGRIILGQLLQDEVART